MAGGGPPQTLLAPTSAALFVCDIQERLRPTIDGFGSVVDTAARMVRAAASLSLPIVVTEHYPKGLGRTVAELLEVLPSTGAGANATPASSNTPGGQCVVFEKTRFSMATPEVVRHLRGSDLRGVTQVLLVGIEAHVCVLQTALDLAGLGYQVHVLVDGVGSRGEQDRAVALQRMAQAGVVLSSSEAALFELTRDAQAGQGAFKVASALAKEQRAPHVVRLRSNL